MINIDDKYFIDADRYGYIIRKKIIKVNKETGKEEEKCDAIKYTPNLSNALDIVVEMKIRNFIHDTPCTFDEVLKELKKVREEIKDICNYDKDL